MPYMDKWHGGMVTTIILVHYEHLYMMSTGHVTKWQGGTDRNWMIPDTVIIRHLVIILVVHRATILVARQVNPRVAHLVTTPVTRQVITLLAILPPVVIILQAILPPVVIIHRLGSTFRPFLLAVFVLGSARPSFNPIGISPYSTW